MSKLVCFWAMVALAICCGSARAENPQVSLKLENVTVAQACQRLQEAVYFARRVVVNQADALRSLQPQATHGLECVVVAGPRRDAPLAQASGDRLRPVSFHQEGDSRHAVVEGGGVGDSVDAEAGDLQEAADQAGGERLLVLTDTGHGLTKLRSAG